MKWKGSIICSAALERSHSKFVNQMVPKWLTSNLPRHGPKWKPANDGVEPRNDSVGVIKRSGSECKKDQC